MKKRLIDNNIILITDSSIIQENESEYILITDSSIIGWT